MFWKSAPKPQTDTELRPFPKRGLADFMPIWREAAYAGR